MSNLIKCILANKCDLLQLTIHFFQTFCLLFLTFVQKYVHSSICCDKDSKKYMYKSNLFNILSIGYIVLLFVTDFCCYFC